MESGGSSNLRQKYPTRAPRAGIVSQEGRNTTTTTTAIATTTAIDAANVIKPQQSFKRDADQYMPIANVIRIMRRVLPAHAKIADDAKETIQECVSEFISFVTCEANERCHREYRKTITPNDLLSAMGSLGFDNYIEPLTIFLAKYRTQDLEHGPMQHHTPYAKRGIHSNPAAQTARPPPPPPPPPPPMTFAGSYVRRLPTTRYAGNYGRLPLQRGGGYFMGNQGLEEGSSCSTEFDPFAQQFK